MSQGTMAPRGPISLRAPRICRTIQASRVVERVPGLILLESNAVAPGTMDSYQRAVTDFELYASGHRATSGLEEWCRDRRNMPGIPGPLVHPGLRARSRESVDGFHPDYFHPLQPSWRPRHAKESESSERVDETDAAKSMALAVDTGGCSFGHSVASPAVVAAAIALSYVAYLRPGELATLRVRSRRQTDQAQRVRRDAVPLLFERKEVASQVEPTLSTTW